VDGDCNFLSLRDLPVWLEVLWVGSNVRGECDFYTYGGERSLDGEGSFQ
jgi:hypothetical protein